MIAFAFLLFLSSVNITLQTRSFFESILCGEYITASEAGKVSILYKLKFKVLVLTLIEIL